MARRQRMPLDPPALRKGKRRLPKGADQLFMTRRLLLARSALVGGFAVLAGRLGYMQVIQGDSYRARARSNTQRYRTTAAPRGMIFDRGGRVLAENRTAWQIRVTPADLPAESTPERRRVLDTLISELDLPESLVIDWRACPSDTRDAVYAQVAMLRGRQGDEIERSVMATKEMAAINYLVLLEESLGIEQAAQFREASRSLPGLRVMNRLEYEIGNVPGDSSNPLVVKTGVPREIALRLAANRLYLPGVEIDGSVLVRHYPGGPVMSHLLGYVGRISPDELENRVNPAGTKLYEQTDSIGKAGLESSLEDYLRGEKGGRWILSDVNGMELGTVPGTSELVPKMGQDLRLTIDLELQSAVSRALAQGIRFANEDRREIGNVQEDEIFAKSGAVVALNPKNGEVLAMVSYPHYDNQLFVDGISEAKWQEYTDKEQGQPYVNRAIASSQPPGSTLKVFHALSALHEKKITPETTYTCTGAIRVPLDWNEADGNTWPCWLKTGHRDLDLYGAIKQSCDVYFYNVGAPKDKPKGSTQLLRYYDYNLEAESNGQLHYFDGLGIKLIHKNLTDQFWFGTPTNFDLDGEAAGVAPNAAWLERNYGQGWSVGETINTSIGQGFFEATPLQLAVNTVAIANSGTLYRPNVVREIVGSDEKVSAAASQILRRMTIDKEHFAVVREAMRQVVHDELGSANHWYNNLTQQNETRWPLTNPPDEDDVIEIAGKTGTAEVGSPDEETNVYANQHAWFTCFAPYDDPEIVVTALVEYGGEGSNYAVPVVDQTLRAYFEMAGRRKRGLVLREDGEPESDPDTNAELMPKPGSTVNPNRD